MTPPESCNGSGRQKARRRALVSSQPYYANIGIGSCPKNGCDHPDCPNRPTQPESKEQWPEVTLGRTDSDYSGLAIAMPDNIGLRDPDHETYVPKHLYEQVKAALDFRYPARELDAAIRCEQEARARAEAAEQKLGEVEAAVREEVERLEDKAAAIRRVRGGSHVSFAEASAYDHVAVRLRSRFSQALQTSKPDPTQKGDE